MGSGWGWWWWWWWGVGEGTATPLGVTSPLPGVDGGGGEGCVCVCVKLAGASWEGPLLGDERVCVWVEGGVGVDGEEGSGGGVEVTCSFLGRPSGLELRCPSWPNSPSPHVNTCQGHTHAHTRTHARTRTHAHTHARTHTHTRARANTRTHSLRAVCIAFELCVRVCVCVGARRRVFAEKGVSSACVQSG